MALNTNMPFLEFFQNNLVMGVEHSGFQEFSITIKSTFSLVHFGPELSLGGSLPLDGKGMPLLPTLNGFQSFSEEGSWFRSIGCIKKHLKMISVIVHWAFVSDHLYFIHISQPRRQRNIEQQCAMAAPV